MRYGIPILADRVAPRSTFADSVLLVTVRHRRILNQSVVPLEGTTWADLVRVLTDQQVDTLVCGGISPSTRESIQIREIEVIDNVTGTSEQIVDVLRRGNIHPGFGFVMEEGSDTGAQYPPSAQRPLNAERIDDPVNCLECEDRRCLRGEQCSLTTIYDGHVSEAGTHEILESALDVACEYERTLCRLAELVYFSLDMGYRRLGVAYCTDLMEPASILTGVLQRFFEVFPVCCKVGGILLDPSQVHAGPGGVSADHTVTGCNPSGQAAILNSLTTDLNVIVGLCVGADCIFTRESNAPVTTIFVKDKSLANNPIGAVYSHYYLEDI